MKSCYLLSPRREVGKSAGEAEKRDHRNQEDHNVSDHGDASRA
jgi:hypothetical protein